jgi:hypothetical protein
LRKYVEENDGTVDEKYIGDLIYSLVEKQKIARQACSFPESSAPFFMHLRYAVMPSKGCAEIY